MKIKDGYMMRKVAGNCVVVPMGDEIANFNGMMNLNETGELLFKCLQNGCEKKDLVQALLDEYEVSEEQAAEGVEKFIEKLKKVGILNEN